MDLPNDYDFPARTITETGFTLLLKIGKEQIFLKRFKKFKRLIGQSGVEDIGCQKKPRCKESGQELN